MYTISTKVIIESATVVLEAEQIVALSAAAEPLRRLCDANYSENWAALAPVQQLLDSLATMVNGAVMAIPAAKPKRKSPVKKVPFDGTSS